VTEITFNNGKWGTEKGERSKGESEQRSRENAKWKIFDIPARRFLSACGAPHRQALWQAGAI